MADDKFDLDALERDSLPNSVVGLLVRQVRELKAALQQIEPLAGQLASMDSGIGKEIHWRARKALGRRRDG